MPDQKTNSGSAGYPGDILQRPYVVDEFHRKYPHLKHHEAAEIVRETNGDRKRADAIAGKRRK